MKRVWLAFVPFALTAAAFGVTPSNVSLKGIYAINYASPNNNTWYAVVSCPNFNGQVVAGSEVSSEVVDGTLTFDGKGNISYAVEHYGKFDQSLSNATVTWTCNTNGDPVISNSGNAVYDAPSATSGTGTYSIQSNYTGAMTLSGVSQGFVLRITSVNAKALAAQFMFHGLDSSNRDDGDGTGVLQ